MGRARRTPRARASRTLATITMSPSPADPGMLTAVLLSAHALSGRCVPGFFAAQVVGAAIAIALVHWLYPDLGGPDDTTLDDVVIPHASTQHDHDGSPP